MDSLEVSLKSMRIGLDNITLAKYLINSLEVNSFITLENHLSFAIIKAITTYIQKQNIQLINKLPVEGAISFLGNGLSISSLEEDITAKFVGGIKIKKTEGQTSICVTKGDNVTYTKMREGYYFDESCPYTPKQAFEPDLTFSHYTNFHGELLQSTVYPYHAIEYTSISEMHFDIKELKTQFNVSLHSLNLNIKLEDIQSHISEDLASGLKDKMFPILHSTSKDDTYDGKHIGFTYYRSFITGKDSICSCALHFLDHLSEKLLQDKRHETYTYELINKLKESSKDRICHICHIEDSDLKKANSLYGEVSHYNFIDLAEYYTYRAPIKRKSWVYDNLDKAFKASPWVNESKVFNTARELLPSEKIIREGSPHWLDKQRLDVYFPDLKLAIEYQGKQHYEAIDFFGGEAGLQKNLERDARKASLCEANNINLIYVTYKESVTLGLMKRKLRKYL